VAADALAVAERLGQALAEHDARILGRVMVVDVQVALGAQRDVDQAVAAELLEHMVEEADAGLDVILAGAVEIDRGGDAGLLGHARDEGPPTARTGGRQLLAGPWGHGLDRALFPLAIHRGYSSGFSRGVSSEGGGHGRAPPGSG